MKKIHRIILILFAILLIAIISINVGFYYINKPRTISQSKSKDCKYTLYFIETESPLFFSQSKVRIILKNGDEEKYEFNTEISNDGKRLDDKNWKVNWKDNCVNVELNGEEQSDEVFTIYYVERKNKESKRNSYSENDNKTNSIDEDKNNPQEKLDKMKIDNLIKISNSKYGIIEMDSAMARSLWYFVELSNNKMKFISEIPDTSPNIKANIEKEKIVLKCEDINGNTTIYESIDKGQTWQAR